MNSDYSILLDKNRQWDINHTKLLEQLLYFFYNNPSHPSAYEANQILVQLKDDPDLWLSADTILEQTEDANTKFFALQTLEAAIISKWKILPADQKNAIKNYIVTMVVKMGANLHDKNFQHVLRKANSLLVQIVIQEWNTDWKNFIPDICAASQQDQNVCENNLQLLKILSEEIYDYSKNKMTSTQIKELKETMQNEFGSIYQLCSYVIKGYLDNPKQVRISLIETCLNTLHAFLSWIPLGYIFLTDLINDLLQIFEAKELKPACLKCLMEIVILDVNENCTQEESKNMKQKIFVLFTNFIYKLGSFIPCESNLLAERTKLIKQRSSSLTPFDDFCQHVALFLSGFMKTHLGWIQDIAQDTYHPEQALTIDLIKKGFQYLVHLSELPGQIFKICVDFWVEFTASLLEKRKQNNFQNDNLLLLNTNQPDSLDSSIFQVVLIQIRSIMISRMVKPVEALLVIDENGQPVKQHVKNTESNSMYEIMKELLTNLAQLDWDNMRSIITAKLDRQLDGTEWSFDNLNCLCWAIGSISGTVSQETEKSFLIYIIRGLLRLNELKIGKENKAVVASDIMYVVGQYPRFLKSNWKFLKTVVKKLFEFMREPFPGIMEMAVNTFLKISETCKDEFVISQKVKKGDHSHEVIEEPPYIDEIILQISDETALLQMDHKFVFYEAVGQLISAEHNFDRKQYLLQGLLQEYWDAWDMMLKEIEMNIEALREEQNIERFYFILKVHERLASSVGVNFYKALARIFLDLLKLYVLYSELVSYEIQNKPYALGSTFVRKIRAIKKEVVNLMITFVDVSGDNKIVAENFISPLMDILQDYCNNVPDAREPEILTLFTTIVEKQKDNVAPLVPKILEDVFSATLNMITTDFNSNIEHRVNLFKFILAIANNCFQALFNIPADQFKTVIDCIVWAIKHELPNIFDSGLEALLIILKNVNTDQNISNQFYQIYYTSLLQDILFVLTDGLHKSGFRFQSEILALLFQVVSTGYITVPLVDGQNLNNKEFVYQYLVDELSKSFLTISKNQTSQYLAEMMNVCPDPAKFKEVLRDYLIQLTKYDPEALEEQGKDASDKILDS